MFWFFFFFLYILKKKSSSWEEQPFDFPSDWKKEQKREEGGDC